MQRKSGSLTPCGGSCRSVGTKKLREDRRFRKSWKEWATPQRSGTQICNRVPRNSGRSLSWKNPTSSNTVSFRCYPHRTTCTYLFFSDDIYETYRCETLSGPSPPGPSGELSHASSCTREPSPPPSTIPRRKRDIFRHCWDKLAGPKSRC